MFAADTICAQAPTDHATAFAGSHVLVVVEAERADVADGAELTAFVAAADALAGVLDDDELVPPRDWHDRVHIACRSPHVDGHYSPRARADRVLKGGGIERQAFVNIDDHGNRADCKDGRRGRHVGMGRDEYLVAGAEADGGHRSGERVAAACGKGKVLCAEVGGIALLETIALVSDAVAE